VAATVSRDGTLAYLDEAGGAASRTLVWRNRAGEMIETIGQPQPGMQVPAVSPDGRRIAVSSTESGNPDIRVHDLIRSTKTRLTFDEGPETLPIWSPAGREIAYLGVPPLRIFRKPADGTGAAVVLAESAAIASHDWTRDGKYLVYQHSNTKTVTDISYLELQPGADPRKPVTFLSTAANERVPKLSPDGRFLAYVSNESGSKEIYVRPFPDGAGKWQASVKGGTQPHWRSDGKEMYYVEDNALMAVTISTTQGFTLGPPQRLFESADLLYTLAATQYDVSADGQRFVTIAPVQQNEPAPPKIHIVLNWYEEFRNRERD
jgi:Tol biopolymer transport system component